MQSATNFDKARISSCRAERISSRDFWRSANEIFLKQKSAAICPLIDGVNGLSILLNVPIMYLSISLSLTSKFLRKSAVPSKVSSVLTRLGSRYELKIKLPARSKLAKEPYAPPCTRIFVQKYS